MLSRLLYWVIFFRIKLINCWKAQPLLLSPCLLGGIVLLFIDKAFNHPIIESDEQISFRKSFIVGCWQVLAMIPGVSRSAASIVGGMQQKFTRYAAAEFSFFLAVPTMFAATAYSVFIKKWGVGDAVKRVINLLLKHLTIQLLLLSEILLLLLLQ